LGKSGRTLPKPITLSKKNSEESKKVGGAEFFVLQIAALLAG
jgi:hypothetical protein